MVGETDLARPGRSTVRLLWLFAFVSLAVLGIRPLFNPDEGRYVEIPAYMLAHHDWILPHLNGIPYLEKPPLQYWLSAAGLALFGHTEWAGRLVPALAAIGMVGLVLLLGTRLYGAIRAQAAALTAASMLLVVLMGQLVTLDMLLSLWLLLAITGFVLAQLARDLSPRLNRRWMLVCWAAMGLATLTKGLVGILLPGSVLVLYTVWQRDWTSWRHLHLGKGLLLLAVIVVPWFVLVERAYPGAFDFLIVREHFQRYLTKMHDRYEPPWYFLEIILAGSLPWLPQVLLAYADGWRARVARGRFDGGRVLWVAAVFIVAFYSASDSKLAPYVLPVMPLLALLGTRTDGAAARLLGWNARLLLVLGIALLLVAALAGRSDAVAMHVYRADRLRPWFVAVGALWVAAGLVVQWLRHRHWPQRAREVIATAGFAGVLLLAIGGFSAIATLYSGQPLLRAAGVLDPRATVYTVNDYDWTLPFYLAHPVIPVHYRGELEMGLDAQPARGIAQVDDFKARWRALPPSDGAPSYALIRIEEYPPLQAEGLPMRELARDFDHVLVARW